MQNCHLYELFISQWRKLTIFCMENEPKFQILHICTIFSFRLNLIQFLMNLFPLSVKFDYSKTPKFDATFFFLLIDCDQVIR
jgi:hypothetical protein